ncbi:MAG: glycosyltransferase family 2 protein [Pseudomonadota bacterium]
MMASLLMALQAVFVLLLLALTLAAGALALQLMAAPRTRPRHRLPACARPAVAVLVPAHNEAARIGATLASVRAQLHGGDRLLVVADNCSDDTALAACLAGAEVLVRSDERRHGKGHALAFGVHHLAQAPPQVVVAVDAGCLLEADALDWLANTCAATRRPVQAARLARPRDGATVTDRIAQWAGVLEHCLRPDGWRRLGMGCTLAGSGVALPWPLASSWPLAHPDCALNLKLGLDFALAGTAPLYCGDAVVWSILPDDGAQLQRARRDRERLALTVQYAPRLLARALVRRDLVLLALAADLCVPPVSLLLASAAVALGAGVLAWAASGEPTPWALAAAPTLLLAVASWAAWRKAGRAILTARELGRVLPYVLKKMPLYLRPLAHGRKAPPARGES